MNAADGLLLGISLGVPLLFGLFTVAFNVMELHRRRSGGMVRSTKPEQRAHALLNEWLGLEQRRTLERFGYFEVRGSYSRKCYRIHRGRNMNVDELDGNGAKVASWCFGPVGFLPLGDVMLTQKLALETDEQAALAVANLSLTIRRADSVTERRQVVRTP